MSIQTFDNLEALVRAVSQTDMNEWVFTNLEHFQSNPVDATYYIIPEEELWKLEDAGLTVTMKIFLRPFPIITHRHGWR
ncbi:hypothetical protein ASL14_14215 [Paenibacillus sp. IHB B 3084]|uniref:hypothetical protein n=1 Tax=Paenibacillus sp. IHB B 3084 TaxID=867076 RepID=UPI00072066B1|nr:hypothetical protein [Paenibacillus sp. IHB B 3084]ALP37161.1 hypothetical protein ASL14_14215 [Paenibacillus sp. IHB B 3084]